MCSGRISGATAETNENHPQCTIIILHGRRSIISFLDMLKLSGQYFNDSRKNFMAIKHSILNCLQVELRHS